MIVPVAGAGHNIVVLLGAEGQELVTTTHVVPFHVWPVGQEQLFEVESFT